MSYKILFLTLALTAAPTLLGSNASASASATARADDPAHRAQPEADQKSTSAQTGLTSTKINTGVIKIDFTCPKPEETTAECVTSNLLGLPCTHLSEHIYDLVNQQHRDLLPPFPIISSMTIKQAMLYSCPMPFDDLSNAFGESKLLDDNCLRLIQEYSRFKLMRFFVCFVDAIYTRPNSNSPIFGPERCYQAQYNLDTNQLIIVKEALDFPIPKS